MVLNTEFHKLQDSDTVDYELNYDEDYCTKLITNKEDKDKGKRKIFFADFETDVSGDEHRPFLCILQNEDGTDTQIFKEGSCGKNMLDYLPDNSITYFHNLAYDIRMFAHYGLRKSIIKGTRCLSANIQYKGKLLSFKEPLSSSLENSPYNLPIALFKNGEIILSMPSKSKTTVSFSLMAAETNLYTFLPCSCVNAEGDSRTAETLITFFINIPPKK